MGGRSSEHEISLGSARSVIEGLDPERYDVASIEIDRGGRWQLPRGRPAELAPGARETLPVPVEHRPPDVLAGVDVVVPVLHGPFGEDGTVQGLLELAGVPYVGAGVAASALCMDKDLCKAVLRDRGIPVARHVVLRLGDPVEHPFDYPVFVKPARLGSSVGISKVRSGDELAAAVELARLHDEKVLIEELMRGREVECGVLGNVDSPPRASAVGEIVPRSADWYDYGAKYDEDGSDIVIPAPIPDEAAARVQELGGATFVGSACVGVGRLVFFRGGVSGPGGYALYTIPGFTETSVYAKLFEASGISYPELLDRLIALALERHERRAGLRY